MTGKELILYILQNDLENEVVIENGVFIGFMTEEEAAIKFGVGVATVRAWYTRKMLNGVKTGDHIYFLRNAPDPRRSVMYG